MESAALFQDILKQYWGYDKFRPLQEEIIRSVWSGHDTLGLMPTGGGKSITFQIPTLAREGICIVVTPLIALMKDQVENLRARQIKATCIYTGMSHREMVTAFDNCIYGKYKFLYVSPERLSTELFRSKLYAMPVTLLVVDEAHCISQWGYDFRPSYLQISSIREALPHIPILALTATATPDVIDDIQEKLGFREKCVFRKSFDRPNLAYLVRQGEDKQVHLIHILNRIKGSAIVYVRSRQKTRETAKILLQEGISASWFHAGLLPEEKDKIQNGWKTGEYRVIVATNAFGMGIDKPDVRLVVHLDLPNSPEEYYQEAGRAGRDDRKAYAVILYAPNDKTKLKKRITDSFPERSFIKRVYEALGNYLQIAAGAGSGAAFEFNPNDFCRIFRFPRLPVHHALKILEQSGYIEYIEDPDTRSRILFTVKRDDLYKLNSFDRKTEELIQCLLRSYTGLFADYVFIQEELISRRSGLTLEETYQRLLLLTKQHILHYVPRKRVPLVIYTSRREETAHIVIPRQAYEERKDRFVHRIEHMLGYVLTDECCRVKYLLNYFGENYAQDCGTCDICLHKKEGRLTFRTFAEIKDSLRARLQEGRQSLADLTENLPYPSRQIISVLRYLCDEGEIVYRNDRFLLPENKKSGS